MCNRTKSGNKRTLKITTCNNNTTSTWWFYNSNGPSTMGKVIELREVQFAGRLRSSTWFDRKEEKAINNIYEIFMQFRFGCTSVTGNLHIEIKRIIKPLLDLNGTAHLLREPRSFRDNQFWNYHQCHRMLSLQSSVALLLYKLKSTFM